MNCNRNTSTFLGLHARARDAPHQSMDEGRSAPVHGRKKNTDEGTYPLTSRLLNRSGPRADSVKRWRMKDNEHTYIFAKSSFSLNRPLGRFSLVVVMSVWKCVLCPCHAIYFEASHRPTQVTWSLPRPLNGQSTKVKTYCIHTTVFELTHKMFTVGAL